MAKSLDIGELLAHLPTFSSLDRAWRTVLADSARSRRLAKHEYLFRRGDPADGLYVVVVRHIKISIPSVHPEQEKVVEFFGPGQTFGEAVMLLGHPYLIDAQALDDCMVIWIDRRDIERVIDQDSSFARRMLSGLAQRFEMLLHDIETVSLHTADERVAGYLLRQPRDGSQATLMFNKRVIASKLGLKPETLSRSLQHLSQEHLISVSGARVQILDQEALQRMVPDVPRRLSSPASASQDDALRARPMPASSGALRSEDAAGVMCQRVALY